MKVVGVIAEYNPFHNGHQYQLKELRRQTNADYIVIAMSGNFLQRGVPAIADKYIRAKMALENGADLVLELPTLWSTASAEYFAHAGVTLLGGTGVISQIGYGVEQYAPVLMHSVCDLVANSPDALSEAIMLAQKQGLSYPAARESAIKIFLPEFTAEEIHNFLSQPNNILALEYEKAFADWNRQTDSSLSGFPIKRIGDGYHEADVHSNYASATAIRKIVTEQGFKSLDVNLLPGSVYDLICSESIAHRLVSENDFSSALYMRLLSLQKSGYEMFADCTQDLSCKISNELSNFISYRQFCQRLKSKDITYTRISRVLLHILLGITKENYTRAASHSYIAYLRVLGFRQDATPLLSQIKRNASLPLITKVADAKKLLSEDACALLEQDLYAADLYRGIQTIHSGAESPNEFTQQIIRV